MFGSGEADVGNWLRCTRAEYSDPAIACSCCCPRGRQTGVRPDRRAVLQVSVETRYPLPFTLKIREYSPAPRPRMRALTREGQRAVSIQIRLQ